MKPKTYGDWYLIGIAIFIITMLLISCTKSGYKPDQDQTECKLCTTVVQHWSDTTSYKFEVSKPDTITEHRCGELLTDFNIQMDRHNNYWIRYCAINGELLHYDYYILKTN